jgi:hypothetical protein
VRVLDDTWSCDLVAADDRSCHHLVGDVRTVLDRGWDLLIAEDVSEEMKRKPAKEAHRIHYASPGKDRQRIRSQTYTGIAEAMADQWGATL